MGANRPNLVLIFSDQQHWHALGTLDPWFKTPNLDAFCQESTHFTQAFCTTPQCSPSRSTLLTRVYPSKTGVYGNIGAAGGNDLKMPTIGKIMQDNGYYTGYFGKWHLGTDPKGCEGWDYKDFRAIDIKATLGAKRFIKRLKKRNNQNKPFFLVLSTVNPHNIYQFRAHKISKKTEDKVKLPSSWNHPKYEEKPSPQLEFLEKDRGRDIHNSSEKWWKTYRNWYRRCVKKYDHKVGMILKTLKKTGKFDDSVIIITSDHGDMDTYNRQVFKGPFMYDHLMRIPLMIQVPNKFGGNKIERNNDFLTVNTDIVPTILDYAKIPYKKEEYPNGISLRPIITKDNTHTPVETPKRDFVICQYYSKQKWVNPIHTIRTIHWKYNEYLNNGEELYDIENDPNEESNLANNPQYKERREELKAKLYSWIKSNNQSFFSQNRTDRNGNQVN